MPIEDMELWARAIELEDLQDRTVRRSELDNDVLISTVFLGIDHGYNGVPLLFETMIFGGEHDGYQERYSTWEEAEKGHQKQLIKVLYGYEED